MKESPTQLQLRILRLLVWEETFDNIVEEAQEPAPIVLDELRIMMDKGWLYAMTLNEKKGYYEQTSFFDSDILREYRFRASSEGLQLQERFS